MSIKLIFASDSFKGSLSQLEICKILTESANSVFDNPECLPLIVSDGGEGALDAIMEVTKGMYISERVSNPLFEQIRANYGVYEKTAIISMSEASGLTLIPNEKRNPLYTTTYGTGELIKSAIERGYKKITVTIGGSATNDGGMGALIALGAKFVLEDGSLAKGIGNELAKIKEIDLSPLSKYSDVQFTVLSDVSNPLTGANGATNVYGKQKGGSPTDLEYLEKGMINYEQLMFNAKGEVKHEIYGGGGAGGLGFGLTVGLNAKTISGIDYILDLNDYDNKLTGATCVITGEGRIDEQTAYGKVIAGLVKRAKDKQVPVYAIVGSVGKGAEKLYDFGLSGIYSIINNADSLENILTKSKELYKATADSLFHTIQSLIV